MTSDTPAIK